MMRLTEDSVLKSLLMTDLYFFTRYFYKERTGNKFIHGDHFRTLSDVLEKVYTHEIKRLIINLPPRHGKTEEGVINFIAKGLMINPKAKFIHTSYSDSLALENSDKVRSIIKSDTFQRLCPIKIKTDTDSKAKWYTEDGGGVYATSSGGAITGFGAGIVGYDGFGGAIIIDDPLKPTDAYSTTVRTAINDRFDNTIISRCNNPNTPIIIIMQRLHTDDLSGVLLKRGGWVHINLPAIKEDGSYLWDYKKDTVDEIKETAPYVFHTQYQQNPIEKEIGSLFFYAFSQDKHSVDTTYVPNQENFLDISFDFNKKPTTAIVGQYNRETLKYKVFDVILSDPNTIGDISPLIDVCKTITAKYIDKGLVNRTRIRVTGDASGKYGSADRQESQTFYYTIMNELKINESQFYVRRANITHVMSGEMINSALRNFPKGFLELCNIPELELEFKKAFIDDDHSLNEAKKKSGLHRVDAWRYLLDLWFGFNGHDEIKEIREIQGKISGLCKRMSQ